MLVKFSVFQSSIYKLIRPMGLWPIAGVASPLEEYMQNVFFSEKSQLAAEIN